MVVENHGGNDPLLDSIGSVLKLRSLGRSKLGELFIQKTVNKIVNVFLEEMIKSPTEFRYTLAVMAEDLYLISLVPKIAGAVKNRLSYLDVEVLSENRSISSYHHHENGYYQSTVTIILPL